MNSDPNAQVPVPPDEAAPVGESSTPSQPAPATPAASPPEPAPKPVSRGVVLSLGAVSLAALLTSGLLWQKLANIQEQLARQSADTSAQSVEARAVAKQAQELSHETAARVAVYETRLSEIALQRTQLEELMQSLSRSRDENLVVDIESSIRLAQQQAQLTGSVEPLLAALKSADLRVTRAAQPRLTLLQRAIGRDIERIRSVAVGDTPGLLIKMDELVHLTDNLVLANAVAPEHASALSQRQAVEALPTWWQRSFLVVLNEVRGLLRVSRIANPEAALLSPEQSFFLRENFKLKLLNARMGLLARQLDASRGDLSDAAAALTKYFDATSRNTRTAAALLQQVQAQMKTLELPRVDETLTALATAAAGR